MRTIKELHILFREAVSDTFFIWRKEAGRVVRDQGVLIFFILVPVLYPLLYAFIYTGETVREVPAGVADGANTALSRDFVQGRCFSRCKSRGADGKYGRGERIDAPHESVWHHPYSG